MDILARFPRLLIRLFLIASLFENKFNLAVLREVVLIFVSDLFFFPICNLKRKKSPKMNVL